MIELISNELHNYYVIKRRMGNYCSRLMQILQLIDNSKIMVNELQNLTLIFEVNNIFDFNADLSEFYQ
uniref:NR LBD domain-containing protein n=1 Tax=Acrobeloides nanus TaxID=290746 RepID=A0A914E599_9BILA